MPADRLAAGRRALAVGSAGALLLLTGGLAATLLRSAFHWDQETALFPWLLRDGWVLYRDVRDQHGPLLPAALALLPDPGAAGPQFAATVALLVLTALLTALAAWRTHGPIAALLATGVYALWLLPFGGAHLWYDLALGPFYLGAYILGLVLLRDPAPGWRPLALGLLLGTAALVKQQAALALLAGLVLVGPRPDRRLALYLGGAALPLLISLVAFGGAGALDAYLYWAGTYNLTSSYAQEGAAAVPAAEWPALLALYAPVLALALGTLGRGAPPPGGAPRPSVQRFVFFAGGLLLAATLPIWPRYARFHLAAALPLLAVVGGVAAWDLARHFPGVRSRALVPWAGGVLVLALALRLAGPPGGRALVAIWQAPAAPLPYSTTAGPLLAWVQGATSGDDPILVFDLDSTLYRVLARRPPRPWAPLFPWILEGASTAAQWSAGITTARPRLALVTPEFVAGRHLALGDGGRVEAWLRAQYVVGPHFTVQKYPDSGPQEIVGLRLTRP
ncbi:MAG TPA: hypothetical protein VKY74_15875 [Chloroflexia bacterium]|nr:hypothetical protein [Chloroflexia bacterium]